MDQLTKTANNTVGNFPKDSNNSNTTFHTVKSSIYIYNEVRRDKSSAPARMQSHPNEINVKYRSNILNCLLMLTVSYTSNTISRPNTDHQSEISLHHIESFDQLIAAHSTLA